MSLPTQIKDPLVEEANALILKAQELANDPEATAETIEQAKKMLADARLKKEKSKVQKELNGMAAETEKDTKEQKGYGSDNPSGSQFKSFGDYLYSIFRVEKFNQWDPRLEKAYIQLKDDPNPTFDMKQYGWLESKALVENVGADGGFTVFPEFRSNLFQLSEFMHYVRGRAMVIPMRARQVMIPVLDQTGSTAGQSNLYGGVVPAWTEEAAEKDETEPDFRQFALIAHKLALYTEASDELLADSAIGLETLLSGLFSASISNEEEWAFINGSGAGQPLGIVHAGSAVTFRQPRAAAGAIGINDIFNMLSHFMGSSPIWLAHQSTMPQILSMNGPAGNPSYVWIGNGRDAMPTTLMGYPIYFIENCPALGNEGDLILADWSKYVIGDRQTTTIDASKHYKFRNDVTSWRAVHRVGGRPWLSAPLTLRDGATQVSPFVILDDSVGS